MTKNCNRKVKNNLVKIEPKIITYDLSEIDNDPKKIDYENLYIEITYDPKK